MADRDSKLRQVQALVNKANHPNTPPDERDTALKLAERLMVRHAIEQAELDAKRPQAQRAEIELRTVQVAEPMNPWRLDLRDLHWALVRHLQVQAIYSGSDYETMRMTAQVVGYADQLDFLEMLYTSLHLDLSTKLEPKPQPELSYAENLAALREAGVNWQRAYALLQAAGYFPADQPWKRNIGVKFTKDYATWCAKQGREQVRAHPANYQKNFVAGYKAEVQRRLWVMREERTRQVREAGKGTELVLADRTSLVRQRYEELFPSRTTGSSKAASYKMSEAARAAGRRAGATADLSGRERVQQANRKELG